MSLTKLSLAVNNLIISGQGKFGFRHPGWGRENRKPCFTVYGGILTIVLSILWESTQRKKTSPPPRIKSGTLIMTGL
jgi:hypothetical protein